MNYRDLSILNWKLATLADQIRQCEEQQCSGIDEAIASAADQDHGTRPRVLRAQSRSRTQGERARFH